MTEHRYQVGQEVREQATGAAGVVIERKWWIALLTEQGTIDHPAAEPGYWVKFVDGREKNVLDSELTESEGPMDNPTPTQPPGLVKPCPHCGAAYDVSHRTSGDTVLCPSCGKWFTVLFRPGGVVYTTPAVPPVAS